MINAKVQHAIGMVLALQEMNLKNKEQAQQAKEILAEVQDIWLEYGKSVGYKGSDSEIIYNAKKHWFMPKGSA